ncbi:flagellar basal body rod protein FlgB [Salinisphaera sp. Q1T1-3]|uniref:flagellar basal body rod protein FlgB n=1 Tax=Salinisphaera sp. Q1T1-3 TaxID=2321229 RepID=UPI000E7607F3|nr:flagellar basal body rod protein FlgB [Salinisphaera sp. Q1T1-3]RJS95174.1 flagellar basal body rod protein FlgB [Salinisphaera sp. Q1T1-3]
MIDRLTESLGFYSQALNLRAERQKVLASNIANSDTPGYKARDFDFASSLDAAMEASQTGSQVGSGAGLALATTERGHIAGQAPSTSGAAGVDLAYRNPDQPSLDGNTVDMNTERVQYMDNAVHYRADLQILGSQIKGLKAAMEPSR